eukprot:gene6395-10402_t
MKLDWPFISYTSSIDDFHTGGLYFTDSNDNQTILQQTSYQNYFKTRTNLERILRFNDEISTNLINEHNFEPLKFPRTERVRFETKNMNFIKKIPDVTPISYFRNLILEEFTTIICPQGNLLEKFEFENEIYLLRISGHFMNRIICLNLNEPSQEYQFDANSTIHQIIVHQFQDTTFIDLKMNIDCDCNESLKPDYISTNEILLNLKKKINLIDTRSGDWKEVISTDEEIENVSANPFKPMEFVVSNSSISLYDIRKCHQPLIKFKHHAKEPFKHIIFEKINESELFFSWNHSHKDIVMNQLSRTKYSFKDEFLESEYNNEAPISNSTGMRFESFKDSSLLVNDDILYRKYPKRSLRGVTWINHEDEYFSLIQTSDIGDLFIQSFSFEKNDEIDENIIQFHQSLHTQNDYLELFEKSCYDPELDCFLKKNVRTKKYSDLKYKIRSVKSIKEEMMKPIPEIVGNDNLEKYSDLIITFLESGPKYMF